MGDENVNNPPQDRNQRRRRGRYKLYAEPDNQHISVPRKTTWRLLKEPVIAPPHFEADEQLARGPNLEHQIDGQHQENPDNDSSLALSEHHEGSNGSFSQEDPDGGSSQSVEHHEGSNGSFSQEDPDGDSSQSVEHHERSNDSFSEENSDEPSLQPAEKALSSASSSLEKTAPSNKQSFQDTSNDALIPKPPKRARVAELTIQARGLSQRFPQHRDFSEEMDEHASAFFEDDHGSILETASGHNVPEFSNVSSNQESDQEDEDDQDGVLRPYIEGNSGHEIETSDSEDGGDEIQVQENPSPQPYQLPQDEVHQEEQEEFEAQPGGNGPVVGRPSHVMLKQKLQNEFSTNITDPVVASRGEVLLNVLEFCKRYSLPCQAHEDLHSMINSMFYKEVIPETKYHIDKLYSSSDSRAIHFYCSNCFEYFGEMNHLVVKQKVCDNCGHLNQLADLTKATYFILINFIDQFQLLLNEDGVAAQLRDPRNIPANVDFMSHIYDGQMYREFVSSLDDNQDVNCISLTACTDGTPLFKSSDSSIWPLFVSVNELPPETRSLNILLAGLWFNRHPKMDLFLSSFVDNIHQLSTRGFHVNLNGVEKHFKAYLIACCVDSGARGSVQGIHSHNGAFPCNWCLHPGIVEGDGSSARKFPVLENPPPLRTKDEIIDDGKKVALMTGRDCHVNGVTGLSPLLRAPKFHIVNGMVVDVLHWGDFGIGRQFFKIWFGERKTVPFDPKNPPPYYIGSPEAKVIINERIQKLHPSKEVRRMPRDLTHMAHWNAREYENMILYFSIPVLKNVLRDTYLKHWTLFVQALFLLLKSEVTLSEVEVAHELLKRFVGQIEQLYNWKEMTFNVHISNHAAENTRRWGPMCYLSTFAFENGNGKLKDDIHAQRGIPHQIIRSVGLSTSLQILRQEASTYETSRFKSKMNRKETKKCFYVDAIPCMMPKVFSPTREELWLCNQIGINHEIFREVKKIIKDHKCYSVYSAGAKTNNSFAYLKNGNIVKIKKIIVSETEIYLFVSRVRCSPFMPIIVEDRAPFSPCVFLVDLVETECTLLSHSELFTVCVNVNVGNVGNFITVMPNTLNTF